MYIYFCVYIQVEKHIFFFISIFLSSLRNILFITTDIHEKKKTEEPFGLINDFGLCIDTNQRLCFRFFYKLATGLSCQFYSTSKYTYVCIYLKI